MSLNPDLSPSDSWGMEVTEFWGKRIQRLSSIVFDFDGVFTDNMVVLGEDGREAVLCDRRDGYGIEMLRATGLNLAVLSREKNPVVTRRCEKLGIPVVQGEDEKLPIFRTIVDEQNLRMEQAAFVGNDLNDITCLEAAGVSFAVADAHPAAVASSDLVLSKTGGNGAVRELCETILIWKRSDTTHVKHD